MSSPQHQDTARHRDRRHERRGLPRVPAGAALVVGAGAVATVASAVLTLGGGTPAPLVVVTVLVCVVAAGQTTTWLAGVTTTILGMLAGLAVLMRVYPHLGLDLEQSTTISLVALSGVALIRLGSAGRRLRLPSCSGAALALSALVVPVAALSAMTAIIARSGGSKISWAMSNDAAFSLVLSRALVADGGDDPSKHLTAAPLTYEIMAAFIAPGRSSLEPSAVLGHDVDRVIQVLLLLLAAMSVLGAVGVAQVVPRHRVASRIGLCLVMGLVPWTWFVSGLGLKYGFNNALLSGVLVTTVWIAWIESRRHPVLGTAWQALAATALVATWAPLVLVPLALGGLLLIRSWREHLRLRGLALVGWLVPTVVFVWYLVFATLPIFREASYALANDGAMFPSSPAYAVTVLGIAIAITVLGTAGRDAGWQVSGLLAVGAAGTIGALYLVSQRVDNPAGLWGYYPAKYAWLLAMFAPIVCARAVAGRLGEGSPRWGRRVGLVTASTLVVAAVMAQFPPVDLRSYSQDYPMQRTTPDWRAASVFPIVSIARDGGMSDMDAATEDLLRISDPDRKVLAMRYSADPGEDTYINYWLFWQQYDTNPSISGARAYELVGDDPVGSLCSIVDDWKGGVEVLTHDPALSGEVMATCPQADVSVTVAPRGRT